MKFPRIIVSMLIILLCASVASAGEVTTFKKTVETEITAIAEKDGRLVLLHKGGEIDCREVFSVVFADSVEDRTVRHQAEVFLTSGDRLMGDIVGGSEEEETVLLSTALMGNVSVTMRAVRAVFFPKNISTRYASYVEYVLAFDLKEADRVFLPSGDGISGMLLSLGAEKLVVNDASLKTDFPVEYSKVSAIALFQDRKKKRPEGIWGRCYLADGCTVSGKVKKFASGVLTIETSVVGNLDIKAKNIERLVLLGNGYEFLSDMKPVEIKETAYIQIPGKKPAFFYSMKNDRTVVGGKTLTIRKKKFHKGLGMMAQTEAAYELGGAYATFSATIGLDDEGKLGLGLVDFIVKGDGKVLFKKEKVTIKDAPIPINVDIKNVKRLTLVAAFHTDNDDVPADKRTDSGPAENWAVWGNAIIKK
jgi:hypothetical protein